MHDLEPELLKNLSWIKCKHALVGATKNLKLDMTY